MHDIRSLLRISEVILDKTVQMRGIAIIELPQRRLIAPRDPSQQL